MRVAGKIAGAVLGGLLLRHPFGVLIGLAIGHAVDAGWIAPPRSPRSSRASEEAGDPYAVLGLRADASQQAIDDAYRRLMRRHHPDKVAGGDEAARSDAERRAREINAAYDRIRVLRRAAR